MFFKTLHPRFLEKKMSLYFPQEILLSKISGEIVEIFFCSPLYPFAYAALATDKALAFVGNGPLLPHIQPDLV